MPELKEIEEKIIARLERMENGGAMMSMSEYLYSSAYEKDEIIKKCIKVVKEVFKEIKDNKLGQIMDDKTIKEKIPQGEYCNGCRFLIFERQPWLDNEGDCCQHGELTCLRHKTKIEVDNTISNGTPFFSIPLYKKCKGCLDECEIRKGIEENTERLCEAVADMRKEYIAHLKFKNERLDREIKESGADKIKLSPPANMEIHSFLCGAFEKDKSHRCDDCMFLDTYHDMGMSCDICSLEHGLDKAAEAVKSKEPCPNKLTMREACEYVERRNRGKNTPNK